ncbi:MAG: NAD(P)(+) transhydrogenase (Re/Si-specific) subunit beta [candidate division WOR-3 bacterium]|uniref:NAD(P) transhydrogenase subunit beta n=1 Tax=candidate division WOR-3 bacterium TaxID=2052148 RepID=A0A7V3ZTF5_UNCW3
MGSTWFVNLIYLIAAVLFIFGLKMLSHPKTAINGNLLSAFGMLLAIIVTLLDKRIVSFEVIIAGLVVGSAIGTFLALTTPMTAMPQMVGILNGFGGGASLLVAGAALFESIYLSKSPSNQFLIATVASGIIGAVTFWGSMVAAGKLQGIIEEKPILFKGQHLLNLILFILALIFGIFLVLKPQITLLYWGVVILSSILGVLLVIPIGGADMPVVICLLNSYSGLAAAATGFVLNNNVLIISGSLVGASGIILTNLMCKAMNRSLTNVLFGGFGAVIVKETQDIYAGRVKSTTPEEVAILLDSAKNVVIIPGYGMAVSQSQHAVRDLTNLLESRGVKVLFGIHPVAGRMPGHMNVLLAEADIPYDKLKEMDEINPLMPEMDVAIVLGANDVVNPLARTDPKCPIAGMPIIDADKAKTVVVIKRSLSPGFAGIPNPLFAAPNTLMLFADGKKAILDIISALKEI